MRNGVRWVIEGFDSTKLIFRAEMPKGLSVTEIAAVLRQLLASIWPMTRSSGLV